MGCASSDWASTQTTEVPPLMQPGPHLEVQTAAGGFQPMVAVWQARPREPNGKIICFELYRRQTKTHPGKASPLLAHSGSFSSFMDLELLTFTEYGIREESVCLIKLKPGWCAPGRDSFYPVPCNPKSHLVKYSFTECCKIPSVFLGSQ